MCFNENSEERMSPDNEKYHQNVRDEKYSSQNDDVFVPINRKTRFLGGRALPSVVPRFSCVPTLHNSWGVECNGFFSCNWLHC